MQLMPATARIIARQYGLSYKNGILIGDPSFNVKLGAAHLGDLIDSFGGSYVLTLVAYNAGPRRSSEWVSEYGDLRDGKVDPVDWVESIPFNETRQYVQKVLQNLHVYRSRLAPGTVRAMSADLTRGAANDAIVNQVADQMSTASTSKPACKSGSIAGLISACK
jgi:soluble lytic murein transglycosylase